MKINIFFIKKYSKLILKHFVKLSVKSIYLLLLVLLLNGCPFLSVLGPHQGIDVYNNTDSTYYIAYSFNDSFRNYPLVYYEEGTIDNNPYRRFPCYRLEPYSKSGIGIPGRELLLQRCDDKMLRLFFILV
jgi:hypothetical protein